MFILRLAQALKSHKVPYAIVGGQALALHGAVRGTLDVDIVVRWSEGDLVRAQKALESLGLRSRIPVDANEIFQFRDEYIENRNLIAWSFANPANPAELVDLIITHDLDEMKSIPIRVDGASLPVVQIQDLIMMKEASGREQDLADIAALRKLL